MQNDNGIKEEKLRNALNEFSAEMSNVFAEKEQQGYSGWDTTFILEIMNIADKLYEDACDFHFLRMTDDAKKRKLINIANRAMMLWYQLEHK